MRRDSTSKEETYALGEQYGRQARAGQVFCLYGDLGVGKTVFTQGFAAGLGVKEPVTSPTFTIVQEYVDGRLPLYHFDVYRISDPDEMFEVGFFDYLARDGVCFVEWANQIEEILPEDRLEVRIEKDLSKGEDFRRICVTKRGECP